MRFDFDANQYLSRQVARQLIKPASIRTPNPSSFWRRLWAWL